MGDRIVIDITDGESFTPSFYGHWCGLRAIKTLNDLCRQEMHNGINSLMCNFVTEIMNHETQKYSYYLYNHGEANGAAEYDNYAWCFNVSTKKWTTDNPEFKGKSLTMNEADEFVKKNRPCLYRTCKCEDYGKTGCCLKFYEDHNTE